MFDHTLFNAGGGLAAASAAASDFVSGAMFIIALCEHDHADPSNHSVGNAVWGGRA
jgi:hypothetical protein